MRKQFLNQLSRRERQIMDAIYRMGGATAAEVRKAIPDPPSYSAVRALLGVLEEKGFLKHKKRGRAYRYQPTVSQHQARDSALKHLVQTFFDGSVASVMAALVDLGHKTLDEEEIERLEILVRGKIDRRRQK
jgi:BlaI family penicillinase repressor